MNLLKHPVWLYLPDGGAIKFNPSGKSSRDIRLMTWDDPIVVGDISGAPIIERDRGVPNPEINIHEDTYYIVSTMVAREMCHPQVISPNTLDKDQVVKRPGIVGVRSFQTFRRSVK